MDLTEILRQRIKKRMADRAELAVNMMGRLRFRPVGKVPAASNQELVVPPSSIEEIALLHTQYQAEAQVLMEMAEAIDEEYRACMGQPKEPNDPASEARRSKNDEESKKGIY